MFASMTTDALTTTGLALLSVSLWTARVALTAKGRKAASATMAAVEATVFVVAFSRLLTGLDSPVRVAAYATGVAAGTVLALAVDGALNPQVVKVEIVGSGGPAQVRAALHRDGWPTTVLLGQSIAARVDVVSVTTTESRLAELLRTVERAAPDAFWTVTPVRQVGATSVPPGFTQVAGHVRRRSPSQPLTAHAQPLTSSELEVIGSSESREEHLHEPSTRGDHHPG